MEALILPRGARARNARVGAGFGIVTGILVVAGFLFPAPGGTPTDQLANFNAGQWELVGIIDALVLLAAVPFAAYLRSVLEGKSPGTASAAAILFVVGVVFASVAGVIQASEMKTLSTTYATGSASDRSAAIVAATLLGDISSAVFAIILIEAGIVLFSVTMMNSRIFANWVADVGFGSAVVTVIALALFPFISSTSLVATILFLADIVLLAIWVFASAAYLLRSARAVPIAAAVPG